MNTTSIRRIVDAVARSSLTPFAAIVTMLFIFRLDAGPVTGGWRYTLRAVPLNDLVLTAVLLWLYRRDVDMRGLFTRNWRRGLLSGAVMVPVFEAVFLVVTFVYARMLTAFLDARFFGLDPALAPAAWDVSWLRSIPLTLHPPPYMPVIQVLAEELLCRGLFLNLILIRTGDARKAVLGSALAFALLHGQMLMVPWYFLWGCAVGAAYLRTRSLWTPLVIHAGHNFTAAYWPVLLSLLRG